MRAVDALVIGAGPAGLVAAALLARGGASVLLADEQAGPGGQIYRGIETNGARPDLGPDYARGQRLVAELRAANVVFWNNALVWNLVPGTPHEAWIRREGHPEQIPARIVIAATGAMERPVPIPGWTLPGAMTAGAVQGLLKSSSLVPDDLILAGCGPLLYLLAAQCLAAGAAPRALIDTTTRENERAALRLLPSALRGAGLSYLLKGLALKVRLRRARMPIFRNATDLRVEGDGKVAAASFASAGRSHRLPATLVALHEGVIPAQQFSHLLGCVHDWDPVQHCFRPRTDEWGNSSIDNILFAGDGAGITGARAAEHAGRLAALEALRRLGRLDAAGRDTRAVPDCRALAAHSAVRPFLDRLYSPPPWVLTPADEVVICRCEEVTAGALRDVVRQGCPGPNQAKAFLRAGMGPCQGRICGPVVSEIISDERGLPVAEVGTYRVRPPLKPIPLAEVAAPPTQPPVMSAKVGSHDFSDGSSEAVANRSSPTMTGR